MEFIGLFIVEILMYLERKISLDDIFLSKYFANKKYLTKFAP